MAKRAYIKTRTKGVRARVAECAALSVPAKGQHRGARISAWRISYQLTEKQCSDLIEAAHIATECGHPFNRWITITWERNGIAAEDNCRATGRWIKLASDWMRARDYPLRWAWVQETSDRNGAHAHILLHVPPAIAPLFRNMPTRWAKTVIGGTCVRNTVKTEKLATGEGAGSDPAVYRALVMGKVHYMLKTAPKALERALDMEGRGYVQWGRSCPVYGKRLGIWQGWRGSTGRRDFDS